MPHPDPVILALSLTALAALYVAARLARTGARIILERMAEPF